MILRLIGAGLCVLVCFVAIMVLIMLPSPAVLSEPGARLAYSGVFVFLVVIACASILVMLTILDR